MKATNVDKKTVVAETVTVADTFLSRLVGLIGKQRLAAGEGLVITRCQAVHMFFMRFSIDAVFLDKNNYVVGIVKNLKPFSLSPVFLKASFVLELPAGAIEGSHTQPGDSIEIK